MEIVTKIAPICLALIMLALGMGLTTNDFKRVVNRPQDFIIGLICQLILLPIVAFILIKTLNVSAELALGVMIIAAAPGGVTSNIYTKFANGDVALSVSLTAIISLISIISVPFIILNTADLLEISLKSQKISTFGISIKMFLVVTLPIVIGMLIRKFATNFINTQTLNIQRLSIILFVIVFAAIWIEEWDNVISYITQAGFITLMLNIAMMIIGFFAGKLFATGMAQRKGILAVFVSSQLFDKIIYIIPTAAYALVMFITSLIFVFLVKKL